MRELGICSPEARQKGDELIAAIHLKTERSEAMYGLNDSRTLIAKSDLGYYLRVVHMNIAGDRVLREAKILSLRVLGNIILYR